MHAAYSPISAEENKNAMAKEVYNRCFDWIVMRINELMSTSTSTSTSSAETNSVSMKRRGSFKSMGENSAMIGILDIFGFEIFPKVTVHSYSIRRLFYLK